MKKYIIIFALMALLLSANAFAAPDIQSEEQSQPYISTTGAIGTITADETRGLQIIYDTFVMSQQVPITRQTKTLASLGSTVTAMPAGRQAREMYVTSTGYNSLVEQTDSTPFIAADGTYVYDGMVAANFLPFGTKIMFPDQFPGKVFTVHDRMAKRFSNRVDVWFEHKADAMQWGRRTVRIEVL